MNAPVRARVSHDRCVGVGMCVQHARQSFRINADGQAEYVENADVPLDMLEEAAESCPMNAIGLAGEADWE